MVEKLRCIVLRTVKYGDSKLIVDALARDRGRVSMVWSVGKKSKGNTGRNLFQPMTICDVTCEGFRPASLPLVKEAHIAIPFRSVNVDPVKISVAFFLAEFLSQVTRDEQRDAAFYDFVESTMQWYDLAEAATANFHLMFLARCSRFLGFYPNLESYHPGYCFDLRSAEFCSSIPLHTDYIAASEAQGMLRLMRMTPANMHRYRFSREERNRTIEVMLRFYSLHVPGFKEMKSWDVLRTIFAS